MVGEEPEEGEENKVRGGDRWELGERWTRGYCGLADGEIPHGERGARGRRGKQGEGGGMEGGVKIL